MLMLLALACGPDDAPATADPVVDPPTEAVQDTADVLDTGGGSDTDTQGQDTDLGPPPCIEDPMEDNDTFGDAMPWDPGLMAVFDDDPDFFSFELQPGETRRVELFFDHTYGNLDLTVYNELYLAVATSYSFSDDEVAEVSNISDVPTVARIRVINRDPGCNQYSVVVRPIGGGEGEGG